MKIKLGLLAAMLLLGATPAHADTVRVVASCAAGVSPAYDVGLRDAVLTIDTAGKLCSGQPGQLPTGATQIAGNGSGTTGAVVGTLAAAVGKTTYICDFDVSAAGTGSSGPITVAGLLGGSRVYQLTAPGTVSRSFSPCLPASAPNTAITITTTANGTATAVNVNSSGYQL